MMQLAGVNETAMVIPIRQSPVRTAVRFPMRLALTMHTEFGYFHGVTENVSATGLLVVCAFLPEFLGAIEFTMAMPAEILGTATDVSIHCMGRVIRREPGFQQVKAAVVIDEYFLKA
jgi:hypothetical protein